MKVALIGGNSRSALALCRHAPRAAGSIEFVPIVRRHAPGQPESAPVVRDYFEVDSAMLAGFAAVINFAGLVGRHPEAELVRVNADLAAHLATAAQGAGAAQFIQLSSLSVYGHAPLVDLDTPTAPSTPYGRSKLLADERLIALDSPVFAVTLLRVPIIYGPGVPSKLMQLAGLLRAMRILPVPRPLPRRSVISQENLSSALVHLLNRRKRGVVFAADPEPFRLDMFAALLPFKVLLIALPRAVFAPVRWVAPRLYASLFASLEVTSSQLLRPENPPLVPTAMGLREAFGAVSNRQRAADRASSAAAARGSMAERNGETP